MVKRVYRKRAKRTSTFKKSVAAIAKKTIMRIAETKTGVYSNNITYGSTGSLFGPVGGGIISSIGTGTGQNNRVGDQIQFIGMKIRGYNAIDPAVITAMRDLCGYRLLVVAGKRPLTSGDMPTFKGSTDPDILTVISDRYIKLDTTSTARFINQYVKFKRNVLFAGSNAVKNDLYMWVVPPPLGTGLTTTTGYQLSLDVQMYWKDV